jgi:hypothetical protein
VVGANDANVAFGFPTALIGQVFDFDEINSSSVTIDITTDGGSPETVTFEPGDFAAGMTRATATEIRTVINADTSGLTASVNSLGAVAITSDTTGSGSSLLVEPGSPNNANLALSFSETVTDGGGRASCTEAGFEYWAGRRPKHSDVIIQATVRVSNNSDVVGVFQRLDLDGVSSRDEIFCYGAEIIQTSPTAATLRVVRFWNDTREILGSQVLSSYATSVPVLLRFTTEGSTLTAEAFAIGVVSASATVAVTDTVIRKPGRIGIYGETGGAGQAVTVDDWSSAPNFVSTVD